MSRSHLPEPAFAASSASGPVAVAELERKLAAADGSSARLPLLLALADRLGSLDTQQALRYAEQAAALAVALGNKTAQAEALLRQGRCADFLLDHARALSCYGDALSLFEAAADDGAAAKVLRAIGYVYDALGDFPTALEYQFRALKLDERHEDNAGRAATLRTIGVVYSKTGDIESGLDFYHQSLKAAGPDGDPLDRSKTLNNIGINLKNLGRLDEARSALMQAQATFAQMDAQLHLGATLNNLGLVEERAGDLTGAETTLRQALALCERTGHRAGIADSRLGLGRLLSRQGRHVEGQALLEAALDECARHGLKQYQAECHQALAEHFESLGDLRAALDHLRRSHRIEREVMSEATRNKVRALQIQQQLATARREADLLRAQQEVLARANAELDELNASLAQANVQRIALVEQLEQQTYEDALTGIANRRKLDMRLSEEFALARRHRRPLAVAMADLDHFKLVNDRYSHAVGDAVLKTLARVLVNQVRQTDLVARFGGEEFVLVFPEAEAPAAALVCEKIRAAVEQHPWGDIKPGLGVTISFGYCADPGAGSPERMIAIADRNLYQAKAAGRNCVRGE